MDIDDQKTIYIDGLAAVLEGYERRCPECDAIASPVFTAANRWALEHHHADNCPAAPVIPEMVEPPDFNEYCDLAEYKRWKAAGTDSDSSM